ncbi:MAG: GNAT family N-acetyltransferase [Oscillibacter sp.]|nr:GNAT family N-acetyltransferase [Oscillibacter sp.]
MNITIEKAVSQDLDAAAALYGAVCDYLADKPFNPGWRRDIFPSREDAEQYLAADGLYIARDGGAVVGSIALTPEGDHILRIQEAAVHPDRLRQGIGTALLDFAAKEAAARGRPALRLYVWEGNAPAVRAYERNGFVRIGKEDIGLGEFGLDWFYLYEKRITA